MFSKRFHSIKQWINAKLNLGKRLLRFNQYDLPLDKDKETHFLILLIALMSFLMIIALSGSLALSAMAHRWSSGLENKVTIEIAVETKDGQLLSQKAIKLETKKIALALQKDINVKSFNVMNAEDVQALITPWIGDNLSLDDVPLPGLIAVELKSTKGGAFKKFSTIINDSSDYAELETHQEWLSDIIRFAFVLKLLSLFIVSLIFTITVTAIIAAIRARLALHQKAVELLHNMGATDYYITRQFARHTLIVGAKGAAIGTIFGIITTLAIIYITKQSGTALIPALSIGLGGYAILFLTPFILCGIVFITTLLTVLRKLSKMP